MAWVCVVSMVRMTRVLTVARSLSGVAWMRAQECMMMHLAMHDQQASPLLTDVLDLLSER